MFKILDTVGDYQLYKAVELEKYRDKLLDQYRTSKNPRVLENLNKITEECNRVWKSIQIQDYQKFIL